MQVKRREPWLVVGGWGWARDLAIQYRHAMFRPLSCSGWNRLWRRMRSGLSQRHARSISERGDAAQAGAPCRFRRDTGRRRTRSSGGRAGRVWQSAKALGKLQRRYFDTESGQTGYFGAGGGDRHRRGDRSIKGGRSQDLPKPNGSWRARATRGMRTGAGAQANAAFHDPDNLIAHPPAERVVPNPSGYRAPTWWPSPTATSMD